MEYTPAACICVTMCERVCVCTNELHGIVFTSGGICEASQKLRAGRALDLHPWAALETTEAGGGAGSRGIAALYRGH